MGLIRLELKKQPWLLHLAAVIAMTLLFAIPLGHKIGVIPTTYSYRSGVKVASYVNATTDTMAETLIQRRDNQARDLKAFLRLSRNAIDKELLALLEAIRGPLQHGDYRTVNRLVQRATLRNPAIAESGYYHVATAADQEDGRLASTDATLAQLKFYIDHNINSLQPIDRQVSATYAVYDVFAAYGSYAYKWTVVDNHRTVYYRINPGTTLMWVFLTYVALVLAWVNTFDRRNHTENLMRLSPRSDWLKATVRAAVTLTIILTCLGATQVLALLINGLLPGHTMGRLDYPLLETLGATVVSHPLWWYIGAQLLLFALWALLLSGTAGLVAQFVENPILALMLDSLPFTLLPLHILSLLPIGVQRLLPSLYTNPPALLAQADYFLHIPLSTAYWTLVVWSGILWVLAITIQRLRNHVRGPWR